MVSFVYLISKRKDGENELFNKKNQKKLLKAKGRLSQLVYGPNSTSDVSPFGVLYKLSTKAQPSTAHPASSSFHGHLKLLSPSLLNTCLVSVKTYSKALSFKLAFSLVQRWLTGKLKTTQFPANLRELLRTSILKRNQRGTNMLLLVLF